MTTGEQIMEILSDGGKHSSPSLTEATGKTQSIVSKWCRRLRDEGKIACESVPAPVKGRMLVWYLATSDHREMHRLKENSPLARVRYGAWV